MKDLSNKEIALVIGGGRGDSGGETSMDRLREVVDTLKDIKNKNWFGLLVHSEELNVGEQEYLDRLRKEDRRNGHNNRQGNYRRGNGGREIEN